MIRRACDDSNKSMSQSKLWAPIFLAALALALITLAYFLTPKLLISLGPMAKSLTSDIPSVKATAYKEVLFFRVLCFVVGVSFIVLAITWTRLLNSYFFHRIYSYFPQETPKHLKIMGPINRSLIVITCFVIIGILYVAFGPYIFHPHQLHAINREDGIIEYGSAFLLLVCCIVSVILAFRFSGQRSRTVMHSLFAFVFFVMVGEEISWGQRIFGLSTPEIMKNINVQDELNIHNLFGYTADHIFSAGLFIYGFVVPILARTSTFFYKLFGYIGLPVASLGLAISFLMISMMYDWTIYRFLPAPRHLRIAELQELLASLAFCMLMYESWLLTLNSNDTQPSG
jgi:hypothetical protein